MEEKVKLKPSGEEWSKEDLVEVLGYNKRSVTKYSRLLDMWRGIGDTAYVDYNYEMDDGSNVVVLTDHVYWALFRNYNKEMKYAFGAKYGIGGRWFFINEKRQQEYVKGLDRFIKAEKAYSDALESLVGIENGIEAIQKRVEIDERNLQRGVYGVYRGDELVYIGSTARSFELRWDEHMSADKFPEWYVMKPLYTYYEIYKDFNISFLSDRELRIIEGMMVMQYKPKMNVEGVSKPFSVDTSGFLQSHTFYAYMGVMRSGTE